MRRLLILLGTIVMAAMVSADYLTIAPQGEVSGDLYHFYSSTDILLTPHMTADALYCNSFDMNDKYYILHVNNENYSIPSQHILYRDYENSILIFRDSENAYIGKGNEITRLFFHRTVERPVYNRIPAKTASKTDYTMLDSLADHIDADSIYNTVAVLSGEWNYPSGFYNYTRFTGQPGNDTAALYLYDKFVQYGMDTVFFHEFTDEFPSFMGGGPLVSNNVVGVKYGNGMSDEVIVVGAHFDDVSEPYNDHTSNSPGADDNASGIAGVMEMARLFSSIDSDRDIYFLCFSGEEEGLYGSYYFVYDYLDSNNIDVFSMINMDMIAYTTGNYGLNLYGQTLSSQLKILYMDIAEHITPLNIYMYGSSSGSDHYYFEQAGYRSVFGIENEFSPVYHTYRDSISYMTNDFMREVIRASTGTCYNVMNMPDPVQTITLQDNGDSSVTVNWDRVPQTDIAGYRVYYNGNYSDVPDTNNYTINALTPDLQYTFTVLPVDNEGLESFADIADTITPSFIPHPVSISGIRSDENNIYISFISSKVSDFNHYNIYRSTGNDSNLSLIAQTTDTTFTDTTIADDYIYFYAVSVVDIDSNESAYSNTVDARLITKNEFMIVIDETSNTALISDAHGDAFYDTVFSGYTHTTLDADNTDKIGISQIGNYQISVIVDDDLIDSKLNIDHLSDYISAGGKLMIFGWDLGSVLLEDPSDFPAYSDSNSIQETIFGIDYYNRMQSFDMEYILYNDGSITDSIFFESDKLPRGSGGKLNYAGIFGLENAFVSLGDYISASSDTAFNSKSTIYINPDSTLIIVNAPLFSMNQNDAVNLVSYLFGKFGCYTGITDGNNTPARVMHISKVNSNDIDIMMEGFSGQYMSIEVFDINGRMVESIYEGKISSQRMSINKPLNRASGIYFVNIRGDGFSKSQKILIIK